MKVLIVGGVAGGASAAARLRRLDERAEIILFEKGEFISYANCGLPYYIGDVITDRDDLLVQTVAGLSERFNLDVRVFSEVVKIDRPTKTVTVHDHVNNRDYTESYDKLILSPGAEPKRPPLPGIDLPGIYKLRTIPDTDKIHAAVTQQNAKSAVIIGGGFIGVELAENLRERGLEVTIVEFTDQLVASLDREMAVFLHVKAREQGIKLLFNAGAASFNALPDSRLEVHLTNNESLTADMVVLSIGVSPDSRLARDAGLELGLGGSIKVDEYLFTSDPDILAVGDAIEVTNLVNDQQTLIPLAGPANKQGRIAAANALGAKVSFTGVQGTSVLKLFDLTAASTGLNEKLLKRSNMPYEKVYIHPLNHAGYYPGGTQMVMKLLFDPQKGIILGAQAVGIDGVDKRIDVIATAQRLGGTVFDLEELELAYAPPFSSAKDPVNMLGFTAANVIKGNVKQFHYHDVDGLDLAKVTLLDVRSPYEYALGTIREALNINVDDLRQRLTEIPKEKPVYIFCQVGLRGYLAARILSQNGFSDVYNLSGGYRLYQMQLHEQQVDSPCDCVGN
jgi:NADPH-dependent 2,4-dienoyl-CoA reductase/sulfur reductase-like enzyme/rhodanese-related sulfurtransferase